MSEWHPQPGGNDAEAEHHREIYRQANDALPLRGTRHYSVQRRTTGTTFRLRVPPAAVPLNAQRYRVKGVYSTYLVCRTWNGVSEGAVDVYVAKPPHLRWYASSWPGMTLEGNAVTFTHQARTNNMDGQRTAAQTGSTDQVEIIVPVWQWGVNDTGSGSGVLGGYDEIWADAPRGGTGVTTIAESEYAGAASPAPEGTLLTLMDDNRNGRYWEQVG
jgi:hypothetical protein